MKSWLVKFQLHGRKFQIASKNVALAKGNILADYLISTAFDIIQLAKQKVRRRNGKNIAEENDVFQSVGLPVFSLGDYYLGSYGSNKKYVLSSKVCVSP